MALSGASVPSGAWVLAGNAAVAVLLPSGAVGTARWVSAGSGAGATGLGADVALSTGGVLVAAVSLGVGAWPPQASMAARIIRIADTAVSVLLPLIRALTT